MLIFLFPQDAEQWLSRSRYYFSILSHLLYSTPLLSFDEDLSRWFDRAKAVAQNFKTLLRSGEEAVIALFVRMKLSKTLANAEAGFIQCRFERTCPSS